MAKDPVKEVPSGSPQGSHLELSASPAGDTDPEKLKREYQDGGDFDEALELCGSWGLWQKFVFFIADFSQVFCAIHAVSSAFLSATPEHWCHVPGLGNGLDEWSSYLKNISIPWDEEEGYSKCTYYDHNYTALTSHLSGDTWQPQDLEEHLSNKTRTCSAWVFDDSVFKSTLVSEFNLVCERRWMKATVQASYMSGLLVGSLVMGQLSDRFGRRTMTLYCAVAATVVGICASFVNTYTFFLVMRFLIAFLCAGLMVITFVLVTEVVSPSARTLTGMLYAFFFGSGIAILPGIAYFVRSWRYLELTIGISSGVLISYYWFLPESPRWLASKGRTQEALKIMKSIAKTNGKVLPSDDHMLALISRGTEHKHAATTTGQSGDEGAEGGGGGGRWFSGLAAMARSQYTLIRTPVMRRRSLISFLEWFVSASVYYGLIFSGGNIKADPFLMIFVSGVVELPATIIFIFILDRFGRRPTMCGLFLVCGACCLLILAVPQDKIYINFFLVNLGKFFDTAVFQQSYIYTSELMPTSVRNIAVGTSSMFARIGCVLTPYVIELLGEVHYALPSTIFGIVAVLAGLLTLLLPETNKKPLPETVEEVEAMGK
ncbi:organic cation transporter protein-like isoform X3 [Penaeus japonicus]|uniref:organic cation transporter protein-like isoform X1 n=1 Tax=Penaeus japonicus TaxID=27405 RepID=UPI001C70E228|nr:organic cation transporter protein-like isoform X1 [Penaeus japonicus]XP_042890733.1 organic cation transporter protein-like isoform X2 [Penaeus japonicus]XP_042890741.1 organic cation transporter protein-like isoform X3 [Penaeus japonicus]